MLEKVAGRAATARAGVLENGADIARSRRSSHAVSGRGKVVAVPVEVLDRLALQVERIGRGRATPEDDCLAKLEVAGALRAMTRGPAA